MPKIVQPLKFYGGKRYLAEWIASLAPAHKHRVYLYAGGLGEAWNWPAPQVSEVANDINGYLINFYRVLQDEKLFADFRRKVSAIPFARLEWNKTNLFMQDLMKKKPAATLNPPKPDVHLAVYFFVWNRQSMAGRMDSFSPLTKSRTRGGRNGEVNAWWGAVEGLPEVRQRLDNFVIEHDDALNVIEREDRPTTLFYADPAYLVDREGGGRSTPNVYECETPVEHHEQLVERLAKGIRGKFMLSGYRTALYDKHLTAKRGWTRHEKKIDNKSQKGAVKRIMTECLYCNF